MQTFHEPRLILFAWRVIAAAWLVWVVVWFLAALRTKRVLSRESVASRISYRVPLFLAVLLLVLPARTRIAAALIAAGPPAAWLYARFIPAEAGVVWLGVPLVLIGMGFAFWARLHLAGNWSGTVTLKQDHALVRTGPYRVVRHPIYTGLILAIAGTACAVGEYRGLVALALACAALWYKSGIEERLMEATFGDAYRRYSAEVRALIPFIL